MSTVPAQSRPVGLAPLSLISTSPPELVVVAAEAGFDFIGARVRPVTAQERRYDLQPGSPMLAETLRRLDDTDMRVLDIEFLLVDDGDERSQRDSWLRMLEAGQALGASTMTVACADPDPARFVATLERMVLDAHGFGITPSVEPIRYQRVNSMSSAAAAARASGAGIVVDALHFRRFGGTLDELAAIGDLVRVLQICDGPARAPVDRAGLVHESRVDRLPPGEGDLGVAEIIAALPADLPVSVETPSPAVVERVGELGWARRLHTAARRVLADATTLPRGQSAQRNTVR